MQLQRSFSGVVFTAAVIEQGIDLLKSIIPDPHGDNSSDSYRVVRDNESWSLDSIDEWLAEYARGTHGANLYYLRRGFSIDLRYWGGSETVVGIKAPTRGEIERVMRHFVNAEPQCKVPPPPPMELPPPDPVRVFLGHGHSDDWKKIKDHLHEKQGYEVEAYEVGARAGHTIRDVLETMLVKSSIAFLVMTAEDEVGGEAVRARQNVVHEVGLFQGRLGFGRAIAVVEKNVEVFSNLHGLDQIRYATGHVESTFGEVLATIRREFADRR